MNDEQKLFEELSKVAAGMNMAPAVVLGACINLMVNAVRQTTSDRNAAEAIFNRIMPNIKTMLLDVHYDPATGKRRNVFPFTQVVEVPFHQNEDVIFTPRL